MLSKGNIIDKDIYLNILKSIAATLLMGTAITLFVSCELGSDPMTIFLDGFHRMSDMEISLIDQILNILLLVIGLIVNRKLIGINTIINVLTLGICIEIPTYIINPMNLSSQGILMRILAMVIAQILLSTSLAWLQTFSKGISNIDAILFYIVDRFKIKYRIVRMIYDAIFLILGYCLGGILGIGTIFSVLTTGFFTEKIRILIDIIHKRQRGIKNERKYSPISNDYNS